MKKRMGSCLSRDGGTVVDLPFCTFNYHVTNERIRIQAMILCTLQNERVHAPCLYVDLSIIGLVCIAPHPRARAYTLLIMDSLPGPTPMYSTLQDKKCSMKRT